MQTRLIVWKCVAFLSDIPLTVLIELQVARNAVGVLSTENRKIWSHLRSTLAQDKSNESCLEIIDNALFVVCLDDDPTIGGKLTPLGTRTQ